MFQNSNKKSSGKPLFFKAIRYFPYKIKICMKKAGDGNRTHHFSAKKPLCMDFLFFGG